MWKNINLFVHFIDVCEPGKSLPDDVLYVQHLSTNKVFKASRCHYAYDLD